MYPRQGVILIGGLGTRLGSLTRNMPKPMLDVAGRPFLEHTIAQLARFGVQEILLLAGFEGAQVKERYEGARLFGADISVVVEPEPLGTGGALSFAAARLQDLFFLCNGDTFFDADLVPLIRTLDDEDWSAALLLREIESGARYGCVELDATGAIRTFSEKQIGRAHV